MGKATKNYANSGGDERNANVRRYKSTSNPSKTPSNASLAKKVGEPESSSRTSLSGNTANANSGIGKNYPKSKLRSPAKLGPELTMHSITKSNTIENDKEMKISSQGAKLRNQGSKMKPATGYSREKQRSVTPLGSDVPSLAEQAEIQKKDMDELEQIIDDSLNARENGQSNGVKDQKAEAQNGSSPAHDDSKPNGTNGFDSNGKASNGEREDEFSLLLESEEHSFPQNVLTTIEQSVEIDAQTDSLTTTEEAQASNQNDSESYSVDVVESTTSEISEITESTSSDVKDKDSDIQNVNDDPVLYDNITLKDVQIKLNDCLKDKAEDSTDADRSQSEQMTKEATFGKTLRHMSGRSSIGRMRHITLRERQPSPNSSLFVNTSNLSTPEGGSSDYKILRHRNTLLELNSGKSSTPVDRKRKFFQDSLSPVKKLKLDGNGWLNASFEFLKHPFSLIKPIQASSLQKTESNEAEISTAEEVKADDTIANQKWCAIM
ncbi:hypothetical protein QAD02_022796 [Eretmocerus hayati]|uniref:Uncharacterized protein n=1 Tax=Eretmocerus hayati TaxID=131215 RepID=A0ACC2PUB8_9HYME|nr:hypothetical protein QAD02_022796 [Eretmocerus hayati]